MTGPLANSKHEKFARGLAAGLSGRAAWDAASGETITSGSSRTRARLLRRRPEIQARVAALVAERAQPEDLAPLDTLAAVVALIAECVDRLADALDAAPGKGCTPSDTSRGRAVLSAAISRLSRVKPPETEPIERERGSVTAARFQPIPACVCPLGAA